MNNRFFLNYDRHTNEWILKEMRWNNGRREEREILRDRALPVAKAHLMAYSKAQKAGA